MSLFKSFITKSVYTVASAPPKGREAIALFFYGQAPAADEIVALAPEAETSIADAEGKTRVTVAWPDVTLVISIDPAWDKAVQMEGMRGWVERFPQHVRELKGVKEFVDTFDTVSACYGTVTTPALDANNKAINLLKTLIGKENGFFFSRNSFYDTSGLRITGYDEDPVWLGTPPQA